MRPGKSITIDDYLVTVTTDQARHALAHIRTLVKEELPEAVEVMSYGIPGFNYKGYLIGFAAFKNHCSLFPGAIVEDFANVLGEYKTSKGTIQFSPLKPLPDDLIREIIRACLARRVGKV